MCHLLSSLFFKCQLKVTVSLSLSILGMHINLLIIPLDQGLNETDSFQQTQSVNCLE